MKIFQVFLLICFVSIVLNSNVKNITTSNFNQTVQNHKYVMIKFYAPWCTHCKNIIPQFQKLAQLTKDNDIVIGQVDATQQIQIAQKYKISGFPTIKFFTDGISIDYKGGRTADQMYSWIKKVTEAQLKEVTQKQIDQLKQKQKFVIYFGKDPTKKKVFQLLTIVDHSVKYFISPSQYQKIVVYLGEKKYIQYPINREFSVEDIRKWVLVNTLQTVAPLSSEQILEWVFYEKQSKKDVALLLKQNDLSQQTFKKFEDICQKNKDKLKCCFVNKSMQIYEGVKSYVRSKGNSVLALTRNTLKQAYPYPNELAQITLQQWNNFVKQTQQGEHKNLAGIETDYIQYQHAKKLTTQNYTSFIKDNQIVFVQYVSPGCAHCVQFQEAYDSLAKQLYQNKVNMEIAAIDLKRNMQIAAQLKISNYPSFRLYLSGAFIDYKGSLDKKQMLSFINKSLQTKIILVNSIAQVPSPSVLIYDPAQTSSLKYLPAIFNRYPVYQLKQGNQIKVILRGEDEKEFPINQIQMNLSSVARWLLRQSDPILVDLLMPSMEGKLKDALQNQIHLLGIIDVEPELSVSLRKTLEQYCKTSSLVCGYAKKGQDHFEDLMTWAEVDKDITTSELLYVNTETFQKYIFTEKIEELNIQKIQQFVSDIKKGKIKDNSQINKQNIASAEQQNKEQRQKKQAQQNQKLQQSPNQAQL